MESLYLLILLFFIILIIVPLGFRAKVFYSLKSNAGAVSIKLWFLWLKKIKLKIKGKKIYILQKYKDSEIEIEVAEPQLRFLQFFNDEVKDKVKFRDINVFMRVGVDNPFYSALFSSTVSDCILTYFAILKNSHKRTSFKLNSSTSYDSFNFIIALNARFSLSILDVLYSFVISILRTANDRLIEKKLKG